MITGNFSVKKAIKEGWKLTKEHWLVMIGLMLGYTILNMLLGLFSGSNITSIRYIIVQLVILAISMIFTAGYTKMYLVATDGEEPEFNLFSKCAKKAFPLFVISILLSIGIVFGIILLIVPGLWFAARFGFAALILLDREKCGIIEAFKESFRLTKGHEWELIGMMFISLLIYIGGVICLIVGIFLSTVWVYFAYTTAFRQLQNEDREKSEQEAIATSSAE